MRVTDEKGFTLVEILAAIGIFSILMTFTVTGFMNNLRTNYNMELRYEAVQAAQNVIDSLRVGDVSQLGMMQHADITVDGRDYSVDVAYCTILAYCTTNDIKHIAVKVSYKSQVIYETDTVFSKL